MATRLPKKGETVNVKLIYKSYPEKNEIVDIETDLTEEELVKGINAKLVKIQGEYLHDSKQHALVEDGLPVVTVL